ncbi:PKD domain-containing protein, partial [Candidatus Bathyarchaeota archaeon]
MRRSVVLFVSPLLLLLPTVIVFASTSVSFQNNTIILPGLASSLTASPSAVTIGQPVSLSCSAEGGTAPYAYFWTLGDGNTGTGPDPSHVYNIQGLMRVVCSVTDGSGRFASSLGYIT